MVVQITWLFILILNLLIIWSTILSGKGTKYIPLGIIIWTFLIVYMPFTPQPQFIDMLSWQIIGIIILLLGIILFGAAYLKILKIGLSSYYIQPSKLIIDGPYKLTRHPQSLSLILMFVGVSVARRAINCLYLIPFIILLHWLESILEEKLILEKKFPQQYKKYKQKVGMFLPKIK